MSTTDLNTTLGNYPTTSYLTSNYLTETATNSAISTATQNLVSNTGRSEEHTSELQSHSDLVCRLLLEKKKEKKEKDREVFRVWTSHNDATVQCTVYRAG